jgi:hypothetical protein
MTKAPFIEADYVFEHNGRKFEAGGAVVTPDYIVAYPGEDGVLNDWHGRAIGTWRAVSTWKTPRSFYSSTMSQIEATVDSVIYTGRGAGLSMIYRGRRKAARVRQ